MTTDAASEAAGKLAALGYRDFRLFWSGQLISNIGTWMQMTATSWLLYQLTGSAVLLGLNGIFRAIPALTLGWSAAPSPTATIGAGCFCGLR